MTRADKFWPSASSWRRALPTKASIACVCLSIFSACGFSSCDRVMTSRYAQLVKDADGKSAQGDFLRAIDLYEAALDDSPRCAEIHYKLALLYDDKMNDPLDALHHFKRYLVLSPNGSHASDVKNSVKRDEIAVVTSLSGDTVVTRAEAARLRNENLNLHKNLKRALQRCRSARVKRKHAMQAPKKPPRGNLRGELTLFGQVIHSCRFRGSFTNHQRAGKGFSTQTKRASAIRKNSRWAKRSLFRRTLLSR
jgi:tetratricopeptide (TPR) repeat protein